MRARNVTTLLLGAACAVSLGHAADPIAGWQSLGPAIYFIHGGTLADRQIPSQKDRKLSIVIDGQPAREIFDSIGPDLPATCSGEKEDRTRNKQGIHCSYTAEDKGTKEGPYRCWIGLDLRTGASIGLVGC